MRVIGGSARGRRLRAPKAKGVRPTADRVREAIFDVLEHLDAIEGQVVVDLFAGSGALGIEALSRGASLVTLVENDRQVLAGIEANLISAGFAGDDRVRVVHADAPSWVATHPEHIGLALIDPPYDFENWPALLENLDTNVAVCESNRPIDPAGTLVLYRVYRYGTTLVTVSMAPKRRIEEVLP